VVVPLTLVIVPDPDDVVFDIPDIKFPSIREEAAVTMP
jgi:hypothetical protein